MDAGLNRPMNVRHTKPIRFVNVLQYGNLPGGSYVAALPVQTLKECILQLLQQISEPH